MKIEVSKEFKKHMDASTLQTKVERLKRLYDTAKKLRATNTYDLKIDLERSQKQLNDLLKGVE